MSLFNKLRHNLRSDYLLDQERPPCACSQSAIREVITSLSLVDRSGTSPKEALGQEYLTPLILQLHSYPTDSLYFILQALLTLPVAPETAITREVD